MTEGKGEQIGDVKNETMNIYAAQQKRFQAGEVDASLRSQRSENSTPSMTDYKHLAAIRQQIAKYIPNGKIDGHDVANDFNKIDMTKPENYMAYKMGINRAMLEQEKIKSENSSYVPRWMRFGDSTTKYNDAESQLNVLTAAENELGMFETKIIAYKNAKEAQIAKQEQDKKDFAAAIEKLDKNKDGKLSVAELNVNQSGASANVLDKDDLKDIQKIMSANGNQAIAEKFEKSLAANGIKFDGSVAVNTPPEQTPPVDKIKNTQVSSR